jgi:hypothetical protein
MPPRAGARTERGIPHVLRPAVPPVRGGPGDRVMADTPGSEIAVLPPKIDHEMVCNSSESLDPGPSRVSNHISVISWLADRIRCRRPRFDHLFELRWPHIKTVVRVTMINETR